MGGGRTGCVHVRWRLAPRRVQVCREKILSSTRRLWSLPFPVEYEAISSLCSHPVSGRSSSGTVNIPEREEAVDGATRWTSARTSLIPPSLHHFPGPALGSGAGKWTISHGFMGAKVDHYPLGAMRTSTKCCSSRRSLCCRPYGNLPGDLFSFRRTRDGIR